MELPLPVLYLLVVLLFGIVGVILTQARRFEYDYKMMPDLLRRRRDEALSESAWLRFIDPLVSMFAAIVPRLGLENHRARVQRKLVLAGNPSGHTAETFVGECLAHALLAYLATTLVFLMVSGTLKPLHGLLPALVIYMIPHINLGSAVERRRVLIDRHMPYMLDLITLTMGAGSTFLEACVTITQGDLDSPLIEEIDILLAETRAGTRFQDGLVNMTRRSESEELALMVQGVTQGEELGTPLVEVFERQAETNRFRRSQRGEQTAARLPNRLAVPNTLLMFSVLLLLFGPIIVKATRGELM
jgi:tight adherence protein C